MYTDFEFANQRLSDFGCIMCHINTESGSREIDIGCDITFTTVKNNHSSVHRATSSTYENVYTTTFEIMKYECNNSDIYMSSLEARAITKWLNRRGYYKFKLFNDISIESDVHYYGSFNVKQNMHGTNIISLSLTFTSNAPYGFAEELTTTYMMLNSEDKISIYGDSDEYTTILPKIEIKCFQDCDKDKSLILTNHTTGSFIEIKNCKKGEIIVLDGEHKIPLTNNKEHEKTFANDFNYEYFEILVDEDIEENIYSSTLPCELKVSYLPIRKVGVY